MKPINYEKLTKAIEGLDPEKMVRNDAWIKLDGRR